MFPNFVYCEFGLTKPPKLCFVDVQGWLFFYLKVVVSLSVKHYHTNLLCNYWLFWLEIVHSVCRLKTGLPPRNVFKDVGVVSCFIQMLWTYYTVCCSLSANGAYYRHIVLVEWCRWKTSRKSFREIFASETSTQIKRSKISLLNKNFQANIPFVCKFCILYGWVIEWYRVLKWVSTTRLS